MAPSSSSPINSMFGLSVDLPTLLKANDISLEVQSHLVNVYAALAATVLASAVGAATSLRYHLESTWCLLATLLGFCAMLFLAFDQDKTNYRKRTGILLLFGSLQGVGLGPLIGLVLRVDPSILVTALLATTSVFICFAGTALFAKRRSYLYLGGILSSGLMVLMVASLLSIFLRNDFFFSVHLYVGLAIFCGYVIFDTQLIVEKAAQGDRDFPWHAAELFIDFVGIFVRICIILLRNREGRCERSGNATQRTFRR